jgi:two-component system, response regulator PdtaR
MKNLKILVVEDEAIVALDIKEKLIHFGYDVCGIAANSEKVFLILEKVKPDIILMDIKLRGNFVGIQLAKEIKEKFSIPSIFVTAFSDENTLRLIKEFDDKCECILKPFEDHELLDAIHRVARQSV